jgi:hypothetical protein
MAELRERRGTFEEANLTVEQVQEWLANPCTIALRCRIKGMLSEATTGVLDAARNFFAQDDANLAEAVRYQQQLLLAVEQVHGILEGANIYASDK